MQTIDATPARSLLAGVSTAKVVSRALIQTEHYPVEFWLNTAGQIGSLGGSIVGSTD